jgi:hypothetical protein
MTIDELGEYGMQQMDDEEIETFLELQSQGVLGLPTEGAPYLIPMSYGFDGGSHLYFFTSSGTGAGNRSYQNGARPPHFSFTAPRCFTGEASS